MGILDDDAEPSSVWTRFLLSRKIGVSIVEDKDLGSKLDA